MLFLKRKKEIKKRAEILKSILRNAGPLIEKSNEKEVQKHPIYGMIRALSNYQLYGLVKDLFEEKEVPDIRQIMADIGIFLNDYECQQHTLSLEDREIKTDLSSDAVLICAWSTERLIDCLKFIGTNVGNPFCFDSNNQWATYIMPIGVTIVWNGNHSTLTGILKGEGEICPKQVCNLKEVYERIYFDGSYYRKKTNNEIVYKAERFELGAIFEIGRLLIENGIG